MSAAAHDMLSDSGISKHPLPHRPTGILGAVTHVLGVWRTRIRDRDAFLALDYRDLRDINLSRWEVERELAKPFWRG
jgi:uncharacterized protein YjiS (DUF1127 family)